MDMPPPNPLLPPGEGPNLTPALTGPQGSYASFVGRLIPTSNLSALSGYYFAIFSLIPIVGIILGPLALIFGLLGMCRALQQPQARGLGHAVFSIATGILVTILNWGMALIVLAAWFFVPQLFQPPPPQ